MPIEKLMSVICVYNEVRIRVEHRRSAETIYLKAARTGEENETRNTRVKAVSKIKDGDIRFICICGNTINITIQTKGED